MKLKFYLVLAFILFSALSFSLCAQETEGNGYTVPTPPREKTTATPTPTPVQMNIIGGECLNCHYNQNRTYVPQADKIEGHLDASDQCIYCHIEKAANKTEEEIISGIHSLHSKIYDDCYTCHKQDLTIKPDCGDCHAGQDMLQPSNGNVFAIHSPKDVGCKECHGKLFNRIHIENKPFPEKFYFPNN